jgi:histidinol-phosphate aminotransferase
MNRGLSEIKPYVGGKQGEEAIRKYKVQKPIKMSSNENPLGVSPSAVAGAEEILPGANMYPDGSNRELREKIAAKYALSLDSIIVGNGADEIIYYLAMGFINDDDEVIIPRLTFPIYEIACRMMRARIVFSAMNGFAINMEDILGKITRKTKLIAVCNPNNPTGHAMDKDEIYRFLERVPDDVLIIMDEAYMEFADPETFPDSVGRFKGGQSNIIIIKTLSKAYGLAGFRVGYGIGNVEIIEIMNRIKLPFNISIVSQNAAIAALGDEDFLRRSIENTRHGRNNIYRAMNALGLTYVRSSTNFVLIDTRRDSDEVTEELMKCGVIVRSAKNYGIPTCIRVTIGTEEQILQFIDAMKHVFRTNG